LVVNPPAIAQRWYRLRDTPVIACHLDNKVEVETMSWKKCCAFLLTLATTLPAFAVDKHGFYMAAGMASDATTAGDSSLIGADSLVPSTIRTDSGKTEFRGTIAVGYVYPLGPKYLVMMEAGKDVGGSTQFSTDAFLSPQSNFTSEIDRQWRFNRNWFVAVKPALRISDTTLAYLSFSHHQAYVSGRSDVSLDCEQGQCDNPTSSLSSGGSLSGTGFGLGTQTTFEKVWFLRVEVESIRFNRFNATQGDTADYSSFSRESLHPKSTVGRVVVGYRF
jgi:hypothetical protein